MEPEPPPITIVNPNAPVQVVDLLEAGGDEREPWEWTPRRRYVALTALATATLVAGVASAVDMVRQDHRQDRASVSAVQLYADSVVDLGSGPAPGVELYVQNNGPATIRLLSAQLMGAGYAEQPLRDVIAPGESVTLNLPDQAPCGPSLLDNPVEVLRLRVRTDRDQVTTRDLPLGASALAAVNHPARERCGYLPAIEAFSFGTQSITRHGREVLVRALVHNDSVLPLTLGQISLMPGLEVEVTPRLPLRLPPQSGEARVSHFVGMTLRMTVTDCAAFFSAPGLAFLSEGTFVRGWISRHGATWEVPIELGEPEVGFSPVPDVFFEVLQDSCPQHH